MTALCFDGRRGPLVFDKYLFILPVVLLPRPPDKSKGLTSLKLHCNLFSCSSGAYFGTGFPHMLFMVHPEYRPKRPASQFTPRSALPPPPPPVAYPPLSVTWFHYSTIIVERFPAWPPSWCCTCNFVWSSPGQLSIIQFFILNPSHPALRPFRPSTASLVLSA